VSVALRAGLAYFVLVFALGFVLGALRVLFLQPALGATAAVLIELPLMLAASWWVCAWLLRRFAVPSVGTTRLVMGGCAFALLLLAEFALGTMVFAQSPAMFFAGFRAPHGWLGLLGQLGFALMPWLQRRRTMKR